MSAVESGTGARLRLLVSADADSQKWSGYVDKLLRAFHSSRSAPPLLMAGMEALRNKRDTLVTKVHALHRHRNRDWQRAHREYLSGAAGAPRLLAGGDQRPRQGDRGRLITARFHRAQPRPTYLRNE